MKAKQYTLAIDLGGTNTKLGIVSSDLKVKGERIIPTYGHLRPDLAMERWLYHIEDWMDSHKINLIGIGSPGPVDTQRGLIVETPNLPNWAGFCFAKFFKKRLNAPCFLGHDSSCAALGEWSRRKEDNMIVLTLGTGVGCGVICDGKLLEGNRGLGCEAGHMTIDKNGPLCNCGKNGCLEVYVGANAVSRLYNQLSGGATTVSSPKEIFERAETGESLALEIRTIWITSLAVGIGNLVNIFNPKEVVLTGGVSRSFHRFSEEFHQILLTQAFKESLKYTGVSVSKLQEKGALIGAALWARQQKL